jgi:hypothetical protein
MPGSVLMRGHGNKRARFCRYGKLSLMAQRLTMTLFYIAKGDIRRQPVQSVR